MELKGLPVINAMKEKFSEQVAELKKSNIIPKLSVIRIGEREDDKAYEKNIIKTFQNVNAFAEIIKTPIDISQKKLESLIVELNQDKTVHGIMLFRPLPKHLSEERLQFIIAQEKDVDCMGVTNTAYVFEGSKKGFPPCTPQAVIEMLDFYGIDVAGLKVAIVGRSLVVGRPLAMLLLGRNATVKICHTMTANIEEECRRADILVLCVGVAKMINERHTNSNQIVIDVGINVNEADGKVYGDVDYEAVKDKVKAITPVPGGVGTVTTSVLLAHTINAAIRQRVDLLYNTVCETE